MSVAATPTSSARRPMSTSTSGASPALLPDHSFLTCHFLSSSAGELNSDELERIVTIMQNPTQFKIPTWFLNRQKDIVDGKDYQILSNGIDSKLRDDLERLKKIRAHRGLRHYWGLRVRGQHTKTTGAFASPFTLTLEDLCIVQVVAARPLVCRRSVVKRWILYASYLLSCILMSCFLCSPP